jgi:hypothetical protein
MARALPLEKRPLTRESSTPGRRNGDCSRGHSTPRAGPAPRHGTRRKSIGRTGERGFEGPSVVLADCFDCRSRRAARGSVRPGVMSARKRPCLAPPPPGAWGERASEAGPRRQSLGIGGGSAFEAALRKRGWSSGHSSMEDASGRSESSTLNGSAGKAVLAVRAALRRTRIATWASEVGSFGPSAEDNAAVGGCHLWARSRSGARQDQVASVPAASAGACNARRLKLVACRQTRRDPGRPLGLAPSDVVNFAQAGSPPRGSMDPSGARVVSRLQKSVRSIFPAPSAGAARRSGRAG